VKAVSVIIVCLIYVLMSVVCIVNTLPILFYLLFVAVTFSFAPLSIIFSILYISKIYCMYNDLKVFSLCNVVVQVYKGNVRIIKCCLFENRKRGRGANT
jgi:hypothetical protein